MRDWLGGWRRVSADRRGNVVAVTALAMPALIGSAGLISDTIQFSFAKRVMQRQVDAGAIAGVQAMGQGKAVAAAVKYAMNINGNIAISGAPTIETPPAAGDFAGNSNAVRVVLVNDMRLPFIGMLRGTQRVSVQATAALVSNGSYCAVALETNPVTGITASGNSTLNFSCGMFTNSPATTAIDVSGSTGANVSPVGAVGGVPISARYPASTVLAPYSTPQPDPYASLPDPVMTNAPNNGDVNSNGIKTFYPGNYKGMDIKGTANLQPGTYYVDGSGKNNPGFAVGAQGVVNCAGCTIVLTSTNPGDPSGIAGVNINGNATLNMTAPDSGTFKGVVIYRDRRSRSTDNIKINGTAQSKLQGAIYMPSNIVEFQGTAGMDINCLQLIARRLTFTGNSTINNTCPANSGSGPVTGRILKLVG